MSEHENYSVGKREKNVMHKARVFRGLDDKEFESALKRGMARGARYKKNAVIMEADCFRSEFMALVSGRIQGVRETGDGVRDLVQLFVPGEICGLDIVCSASRKGPFRLVALDAADIVFVDYDGLFSGNLSRLAEKRLREGVAQTLATESLRRLHKIDILYRRALRDRISIYLHHLCVMKESNIVEINMNREQFAQYLGVNRSALCHELACMRKDGLISFRKGRFEIYFEF